MLSKSRIAAALLALTAVLHAQPKGNRPPDAAVAQAIRNGLPAGSTEANKPLPVHLAGLGKLQIVLFRRSPEDHAIHALVLIPTGHGYHSEVLPDNSNRRDGRDEVATSVLSARRTPQKHALVVLFYNPTEGKPGSEAHARVYLYTHGAFHLDDRLSQTLEGVRTAAVARLKLDE